MSEVQRREVLDLVPGHEHPLVEQAAILAEPLLEADHPGILEKAQELDVVDVAVGIHVRPSKRDVDTVGALAHGVIMAAGRIWSPA